MLYSSSSKCTLVSGDGTTNTTQTFLGGINDPAIDSSGNLWADAVGSNGGLFEISPTGTPLTCAQQGLACGKRGFLSWGARLCEGQQAEEDRPRESGTCFVGRLKSRSYKR